jgi:bifunctional non-homologous end joining protein LigD
MSTPADRLREYRAKRDFSVTAEPAGTDPPAEGGPDRRFVVQKHRARRLHYDLRLEVDGVLVSWAVPKGPPMDPDVRALAVHVEDHPLAYFDFEGIIAAGEYGAGDVIVWDWGSWVPADTQDPGAAIEAGELHFDLFGQKLAGRFALVRRAARDRGERQWLLVHKRDEHARSGWTAEDEPRSVKTGRTNEEVAAAPHARWHSERPAEVAAEPLPGHAWSPPSEEELTALAQLGDKGTWEVGGRRLAVTNLDKVLFPARRDSPAVTKRDLLRYYARVGPYLLPYLADRPVNLHRYPDGADRPGFWQKELPGYAPDWIRRWRNVEADPGETECYAVLDSVPALAWMANYAAIELHPWTSKLPDVHQPSWALIDVDPGSQTSWPEVLRLTELYRVALEHLELAAIPKVTGRRGIQVWVPIAPGYTFTDTRDWVEKVSRAVGRTLPELVSWEWQKDRRGGLARLDYTQNALNKTLVAPFSPRPAPGAPVSIPLRWDELGDPELRPDRWTVRTALDRLAAAGDPLAPLIGRPQTLPPL